MLFVDLLLILRYILNTVQYAGCYVIHSTVYQEKSGVGNTLLG